MHDCNKTIHLDYAIDNASYGNFPALLLFSDRLDVIVNSKEACGSKAKCRISYDLMGKKIKESPYNEQLPLGYSDAVSKSDSSKGFFVSVQDLKSLRVYLVRDDGEGSLLSNDNFESQDVKQRVAFSSAHERYTSCRMPDNPVLTFFLFFSYNNTRKTI